MVLSININFKVMESVEKGYKVYMAQNDSLELIISFSAKEFLPKWFLTKTQ